MRPPPANSHWPKRKTSDDIPKNGTPPSTPIRYGGASAIRRAAMAMWSNWITDTSERVYAMAP